MDRTIQLSVGDRVAAQIKGRWRFVELSGTRKSYRHVAEVIVTLDGQAHRVRPELIILPGDIHDPSSDQPY